MILHQFLHGSGDKGTDPYPVRLEDGTDDVLESITEAADYSYRVVGGVVLFALSISGTNAKLVTYRAICHFGFGIICQ